MGLCNKSRQSVYLGLSLHNPMFLYYQLVKALLKISSII